MSTPRHRPTEDRPQEPSQVPAYELDVLEKAAMTAVQAFFNALRTAEKPPGSSANKPSAARRNRPCAPLPESAPSELDMARASRILANLGYRSKG